MKKIPRGVYKRTPHDILMDDENLEKARRALAESRHHLAEYRRTGDRKHLKRARDKAKEYERNLTAHDIEVDRRNGRRAEGL